MPTHPLPCQVASLQETLPGMVSTFFMSYLQEEELHSQQLGSQQQQQSMTPPPDATVTISSIAASPVSKLALPSTSTGTVIAPDSQAQAHVPKITFLYR